MGLNGARTPIICGKQLREPTGRCGGRKTTFTNRTSATVDAGAKRKRFSDEKNNRTMFYSLIMALIMLALGIVSFRGRNQDSFEGLLPAGWQAYRLRPGQ
ncbi:Hypothetical protein LBCNRZ333_03770 [Lactobacillus delbrueckii subsp. lactis]|nr:Hypothetical protein LBCNRZ333_03770 [Lactobacillus delbrueckii subsp. lactis]